MDHKYGKLFFWRRGAVAADPDAALFARLFRRLLFWYASLLVVLAGLLGLATGATVPWLVFISSGQDLSGKVTQLAQTWQNQPDRPCPLTLPGQGYMLACYDPQGHLLKAMGVRGNVENHFLNTSLVQTILNGETTASDALDATGTEPVQFDLGVFANARPGMVRQARIVRAAGHGSVLGVVQLGTTPTRTWNNRTAIVNVFYVCIFLAVILGVPFGGWYLASKALLPARLVFQRQRDFIANVSHELGTPLALLRANADILLLGRKQMKAEDVALVEDIVAETVYMDKMIDNMLLLARMDAGQLQLAREKFDLAQLAETAARRMQPLAEQARIALIFQQEEAALVEGDHVLLEQVTLILLDNAIKYTPAGGKVTISTFRVNERSCLRVSDTGIGIAPADLERLGTRFYRVDKARSRETGGHGLGLSIAYSVLARHNGKLTFASPPGKGTTATIMLPAPVEEK